MFDFDAVLGLLAETFVRIDTSTSSTWMQLLKMIGKGNSFEQFTM